MPGLCEPCRFHSADDALVECPQCGGPVKFTLFAPTNGESAAIPLQAVEADRPAARSVGHRMNWYLAGGALAMIAVVGIALAVTGNLGEGFDARVKKVKPGMPMDRAAHIMGESDKPKGKKLSITVGHPESHAEGMPDFDRPMDYSGSGHVIYNGPSSGVKIHFQDGVVTKVEEVPRLVGMRRRVTITE